MSADGEEPQLAHGGAGSESQEPEKTVKRRRGPGPATAAGRELQLEKNANAQKRYRDRLRVKTAEMGAEMQGLIDEATALQVQVDETERLNVALRGELQLYEAGAALFLSDPAAAAAAEGVELAGAFGDLDDAMDHTRRCIAAVDADERESLSVELGENGFTRLFAATNRAARVAQSLSHSTAAGRRFLEARPGERDVSPSPTLLAALLSMQPPLEGEHVASVLRTGAAFRRRLDAVYAARSPLAESVLRLLPLAEVGPTMRAAPAARGTLGAEIAALRASIAEEMHLGHQFALSIMPLFSPMQTARMLACYYPHLLTPWTVAATLDDAVARGLIAAPQHLQAGVS